MLDRRCVDRGAFIRMARDHPVRTGLYTVGLPLLGFLHLLDGLLSGGSLLLVGFLCAYAVVCSAALTHYHLAAYRRERLTRRLRDGE